MLILYSLFLLYGILIIASLVKVMKEWPCSGLYNFPSPNLLHHLILLSAHHKKKRKNLLIHWITEFSKKNNFFFFFNISMYIIHIFLKNNLNSKNKLDHRNKHLFYCGGTIFKPLCITCLALKKPLGLCCLPPRCHGRRTSSVFTGRLHGSKLKFLHNIEGQESSHCNHSI